MLVKADIHIHTCLSPCGDITQSPKRVVEKAYNKGMNMIFITDHNSAENTGFALKAANKYDDFNVYPGMEITSKEEVHTLALFECMKNVINTQEHIFRYLPDALNIKEYVEQIIANEDDELEGYSKKSLYSSVNLRIEEIIDLVHQNNGLAIAAHIDRPSFSIISQLGFIPDSLKYDALELSANLSIDKAKEIYKNYKQYKFVKGSDSHCLEMIGDAYTEYYGSNNFKDFQNYLKNVG
jgi:predicted metal-dependent phosphoesterase TrpH